jgi:phage tail sheath protein FI
MPVTPTYPGIYILEVPSSSHTIVAAPTSITVFIGYSHPFKTVKFGEAVELFSYTEYEALFGGLFASGAFDTNLPYAVNQFFLNGGSTAYVIGLQEKTSGFPIDPPTLAIPSPSPVLTFTAREPTDATDLTVTVNNVNSTSDTADVIVVYGSRVETYRKVKLTSTDPDFIGNRINNISQLVTVVSSGTTFTAETGTFSQATSPGSPSFNPGDFADVFDQDSSLDKIPIFNLLVLPGITANGVLSEALAFCERKRAFLIMDPDPQAVADPITATTMGLPLMLDEMLGNSVQNIVALPKSTNGAVYFPYLKSSDPLTGDIIPLPPSGFVSGIYADTDLNRGVWKAPAGMGATVRNTIGVVELGHMTDLRQGTLNTIGVNCLRTFPTGTVVFGARTLVGADENTAFQQWKYVPVRRMALFIEQSLYFSLKWVIFEPNDEPLWVAIRSTINNFMMTLFTQGAFQGSTPSQAFQVKCDSTTTTQTDIDNGIVNIVVAFAPLKPAEFVIIKIAQLAGQVQH